jgi:hypothetical protein
MADNVKAAIYFNVGSFYVKLGVTVCALRQSLWPQKVTLSARPATWQPWRPSNSELKSLN